MIKNIYWGILHTPLLTTNASRIIKYSVSIADDKAFLHKTDTTIM
jgi:hypothetical protein